MPAPVFSKLQLKDQREIVVLNAPASFEKELASLKGVTVHRAPKAGVSFALAFATTLAEVATFAKSVAAPAEGDAAIWVAYPKRSSKRYESEIGRDTSWKPLGVLGYEGVRLVAIDEDWSALRFRRARFIATMKRDPKRAMSAAGRKKARRKR